MKKITCVLLFLFPILLFGRGWYVSGAGSDITGNGTIGTPYQTISKINTETLAASDVVYFERGYTYYGGIVVNRSSISYDAYGTGTIPEITGFTTVTGWTLSGGGVYIANVSGASATLKNVTIDGVQQRIGRFPNYSAIDGGYLTYESLNAGTPSITDNTLTTTPYNWAGASAVIVKEPWVIDVCPITTHVTGTLSYTQPLNVFTGSPSVHTGHAGYGYFIQDDLRTLDAFGEWFLNKSTKDLSIYFNASPSGYVVKASTVQVLFDAGGGSSPYSAKSNIVVSNLKFTGANHRAMWFQDASNVIVSDCEFENNNLGVYMWNINTASISHNTFNNHLSTPIQYMTGGGGIVIVEDNTINGVGQLAGLGLSDDDADHAVEVRATAGASIQRNHLDNIGWNGISFYGDDMLVKNNVVLNFGKTKNDCAAIYTYQGASQTNRVVEDNICGNGNTSFGWVYSNILEQAACHGIYLDGAAGNVYIRGNSLFSIPGGGFFTNESSNLYLTNNLFHNTVSAFKLQRFEYAPLLRNIILSKNVSYSVLNNIFYWNESINSPTTVTIQNDERAVFSRIDSNYYITNATKPFHYWYHTSRGVGFVDGTPMNFATWQTFIGSEANSTSNTFTPVFQYNATGSPTLIVFTGFSRIDALTGAVYNNTYLLPAYKGVIFKPNGSAPIVNQANKIIRVLKRIRRI